MTSLVEEGLVAFFETLELGVAVIPGAGGTLPDHDQVIILRCPRCPHVGGNTLFNGLLEISVETPMMNELTEDDHRALHAVVKEKFDAAPAEDISAALVASASCELSGWHYVESVDKHTDGRWRTIFSFTLALTKVI